MDTASDIQQNDNRTTSYKVSWLPATGNFDGYNVDCICAEQSLSCNNHSSNLTTNIEYTCDNLTAGSQYISRVTTVRFDWAPEVKWAPSPTQTRELTYIIVV